MKEIKCTRITFASEEAGVRRGSVTVVFTDGSVSVYQIPPGEPIFAYAEKCTAVAHMQLPPEK